MKSNWIVVCWLIGAFIAVQPAFAKDKAKGHKATKPAGRAAKTAAVVKPAPPKHPWVGLDVTLSPCERHIIRTYVRRCIDGSKGIQPSGLPPGLARKVAWPNGMSSGWQKTCVPGKVMTTEVHKHCQPLPHELMIKLPLPPPGTVVVAVDGKVLRIAYPTYEILDVFDAHGPDGTTRMAPRVKDEVSRAPKQMEPKRLSYDSMAIASFQPQHPASRK